MFRRALEYVEEVFYVCERQCGKLLCDCESHKWSLVEPGVVHILGDKFASVGVNWIQTGKKHCMREGCTAERTVVREGWHGFEGLTIDHGWGWSPEPPCDVEKLRVYHHPDALRQLAV
jgi:hypothetical protein